MAFFDLYGSLCWHTTYFCFISCLVVDNSVLNFVSEQSNYPKKTPLFTVFALILTITIHAVTLDNIEDLQRCLTMLYASISALRNLRKLWEREQKVYISILIWQTIKVWIYTLECNINKSKVKVFSLLYGLDNW